MIVRSGRWPKLAPFLARPLHTFAHALIRELALECGYTVSSIRECLCAASSADAESMAGVRLYTAAPDSEGTLGGLVSLGEPYLDRATISATLLRDDVSYSPVM